MTLKSLGNPYDSGTGLNHEAQCECDRCQQIKVPAGLTAQQPTTDATAPLMASPQSSEQMMERAIENAVVRAVFKQSDMSRRRFMQLLGGGTVAAALASIFPMAQAKAALMDSLGPLEKTKLSVGFVPITCATPIIMAHPLGFYSKYGLDVDVIKTAGWAVARDKSLAGEYDAAHMLTPMPLAMSMGAGSTAEPFVMPAVENINGQAIVLHVKHKDKRDPSSGRASVSVCPSNIPCTTCCCVTTWPNTAWTPIRISRSV